MEFDDLIVKESPGVCRCCLSEGCYKDLATEYSWMNDTEVYADMLLECFDISISQHMDGPNGPNRLICEVCITRLRDACNFKKQVVQTEQRFVDMLGRGEFGQKVVIYQPLKAEVLPEPAPEDCEVEYLDEDMHFDDADDEPLRPPTESVLVEPSSSDDITVSALKVKGKRGRPKKTDKPEKKQRTLEDEKPKSSKTAAKGDGRSPKPARPSKRTTTDTVELNDDEVFRREIIKPPAIKALSSKVKRNIMRNNVVQVLIKSTVMPFRWLKSCYRCFYCYEIFQEASELKSHQEAHTTDDVKIQTMNNYWEPVVYVDISDIACRLCPEPIGDLYDLIDHLVSKHEVVYNKDVGICMAQFKLDNLSSSCLICGANFYTFGPLLHHTNKDHKGLSAILCEVCGQNFKNQNLLRLHVKNVHENTGALCTECGEKFENRSKLRTHQKNQHDLNDKKYKCFICVQVFPSHYKRRRHMVEEHKTRQQIKCLHCPKAFVFRSMMMTHLRDAHLKVRKHVCGVCGFKAFNSNRLKNHMYKHSGEKNFKCDACDKAFTTKKIMRAHFLRMHKSVQPALITYEHSYMGQSM